MPNKIQKRLIRSCLKDLTSLYNYIHEGESEFAADITATPQSHRESIINFIHYLSLRRQDIRKLQIKLGRLGLSSLGRLEAHVMAGIESVLAILEALCETRESSLPVKCRSLDFREGDELISLHTEELLGAKPSRRSVRIMVTLPGEAAHQPDLVKNMLAKGMNVARINCAHDSPTDWKKMINHIHAAEKTLGKTCRILMDLEGPKLRTGSIIAQPKIIHYSIQRDRCGHLVAPAVILLYPESMSLSLNSWDSSVVPIPLEDNLIRKLLPGDILGFEDVPGRKRNLMIISREKKTLHAFGYRGAYLTEGHPLELIRGKTVIMNGCTGTFPDTSGSIRLFTGDTLRLTSPNIPGEAGKRNSAGKIIEPPHVPCTLPQVFGSVKRGDRIFFDDGKITGIVIKASSEELLVRISETPPKGVNLKTDKGINLPDTKLAIPPLSSTDIEHLDFIASYADMVGFSFVREPDDIEMLQHELDRRTNRPVGVVLKIENGTAFANLPHLLLTALRRPLLGVMVARGDLGVELGFERMAEVQEQILWLCEAAHVPVIWATQVLEQMNKKGKPTRGEVTDAAMSSRAECVMLNKGPYVIETLQFLENVLIRMQDHHHKKTAMLRKLKVSEGRWRSKKRRALEKTKKTATGKRSGRVSGMRRRSRPV